jgi:FkbH-like protein
MQRNGRAPIMQQEPVRLVIWDLDETFWKGTLTEGGIQYRPEMHDLVIALAKRGIMSAICSKNYLEPVRELLQVKNIWDYFIFLTINWEPKGPRIRALIEAVQLRPPTVLFIDDNRLNLAEAQHFVPDIQVADPTVFLKMLDGPLFKGKDDTDLQRLQQYKLLERRKADETAAGTDNVSFQGRNGGPTATGPWRWPTVDAGPHKSRRQRHQVHRFRRSCCQG